MIQRQVNPIVHWLRRHSWMIVVVIFTAGGVFTANDIKVSAQNEKIIEVKVSQKIQEDKIRDIELSDAKRNAMIEEIRANVAQLQAENRTQQATVADIKIKVEVLSTKMDGQDKKMD